MSELVSITLKYLLVFTVVLTLSVTSASQSLHAATEPSAQAAASSELPSQDELYTKRMQLYDQLSAVTLIPWYWLAAIDQYERSLTKVLPKARPALGELTGIYIDEQRWSGWLNPDSNDVAPLSIKWFKGIGKDGDGNGLAERHSDADLLYSLAEVAATYGSADEDLANGLWNYYRNSRSVQRIQQFAAIYSHYGRLDLHKHAFPLPVKSSYSYRDTWGFKRSWGGRRIHEGTDLFAPSGTPVRSTSYGIVEIKGWNKYGGWRIGIRDLNNYYHYFAHLSGFDKKLREGDIVEPGQIIGWVGSSGYGKKGTSGKFPPHLHYGIYSDRGSAEWSFDPYPHLRRWEQADRKSK